ncbi:MAG: divergent PAP2 family protein [Dehalococcoidia bacterium]|nr:divergent PAP2 family protein [Dehalococcoidia bacterium]
MNFLDQIAAMKLLIVPVIAWFIAQVLKVIIQSIREKQLKLRYMTSSGGMPSAHSAIVCALATAMGRVYGIDSGAFAISTILAFIVMYDAAGVRQAVDKQSAALDHLLTSFPKTPPEFEHFLENLVGHTRFQVVAGAALGVLLAWWWI